MIPDLNLLSVPVNGGTTAAAAPATAGEPAVAPVSPDSFEAILTTHALLAGLGEGGADLPVPGGNPQQPGGNDLPLFLGTDDAQALLTEAGQEALVAALAPIDAPPALTEEAGVDILNAAAAGELGAAGQVLPDGVIADPLLQDDSAQDVSILPGSQPAPGTTPGAVEAVAQAAAVVQAGAAGADAKPIAPVAQDFASVDLRRTSPSLPATDAEPVLLRQETGLGLDQLTGRQMVAAAVPEAVDNAEAQPLRNAANPANSVVGALGAGPLATEAANTPAARPEVMNNPPGHPNWGGEFVGRVSLMLKNGVNEARLQLNPPELGQLDIKISTDGDRAVILFNVQHSAAREAIDLAMPRLREMLEQSGLQLAHSEVADHSQSGRGSSERPADWQAADLGSTADSEEQPDTVEGTQYPLDISDTTTVDYYA